MDAWDVELYFVYLPAWVRFGDYDRSCMLNSSNRDFTQRSEVISLAEDAGLSTIDLAAAFDTNPGVLSLWPVRLDNHYNEDGYRLLRETVIKQITAAND